MTGNLPTSFWLKSTYASGAITISAGVMWIFVFINKFFDIKKFIIITTVALFFAVASYWDGFIAKSYSVIYPGGAFVGEPNFGLILYAIFFSISGIIIFYELIFGYRKSKDFEERIQIRYVFYGVISTFSVSSLTSFIFPIFSMYQFSGIDSVGFFIFLLCISYIVIKYRFLNIKVIATELFTFAMCAVLFVKLLLSNGFYDYLINGGMLAVAAVFGLLLVRSVIHEVEQKNKIEAMSVDVKKAYEVEKKAKEELERLDEAKSQFMMATQHHLRTPLTALKGYLSLTLEGDFGQISDVVKEKLGFCFESTNRLIKLVNEFLDISKLQLGRDILDIKETSIVEMLKDIIVEVQPEADKKGIYLTLILPPEPTSLVMADAGKLREALYNLIDNAVKYTEKGGVKVELQFVTKGRNNCAMVIVTDTGIGMTKEEADDVFGRQFERGKEAKKVYALGRGIGLFITASIIRAHKGKIWAESLGAGQGSAFYVELIAKK